MRKRERENPCPTCGHYHKWEQGEKCKICGHRIMTPDENVSEPRSAFSTEILPNFLYVGSYDNASRSELLKAQGISRILNTVSTCQNLYKNSFVYHTVMEKDILPFDECTNFIDEAAREGARVLVHCMSGSNRSPAVVTAYLMRHKGWRLAESYQWVQERRPSVQINAAFMAQLQEFDRRLFGDAPAQLPHQGAHPTPPGFPASSTSAAQPTAAAPFGSYGTSALPTASGAAPSFFNATPMSAANGFSGPSESTGNGLPNPGMTDGSPFASSAGGMNGGFSFGSPEVPNLSLSSGSRGAFVFGADRGGPGMGGWGHSGMNGVANGHGDMMMEGS
eukprot:TRINITY_DN2181_c1_g7_i1.p1 TRINITY_DN2181_c1_g7~~TRINITY_DN2181_c1_g7_i1.p1  ORF type:complete len:334 (+),score=38.08 TRINITY_DN2181_c1_g7_i1:134-1135(+)